MNAFIWMDDYRIGVKAIDADHKYLFEIANELFSIDDPEKDCSKYRIIIHKLFSYIKDHFFREEAIMHKYDYPHTVHHRRLHDQFTKELQKIMKKSKSIVELDEELKKILDNWILNHIMSEDIQIKDWLDSLLEK